MKRLFPQSSRFACPNKEHSSNEQNIDSETCLGSIFIFRGFCKRKPVNPAGIAIPIFFNIGMFCSKRNKDNFKILEY